MLKNAGWLANGCTLIMTFIIEFIIKLQCPTNKRKDRIFASKSMSKQIISPNIGFLVLIVCGP